MRVDFYQKTILLPQIIGYVPQHREINKSTVIIALNLSYNLTKFIIKY